MYVAKTIPLASIWRYDRKNILFFSAYSGLICFADLELGMSFLSMPFVAVGTLGTAVAIMLGFKNNSAYGRWTDARATWGSIVSASRNFGSMVAAYVEDAEVRRELVHRHLAIVYALAARLRHLPDDEHLARWLSREEQAAIVGASNRSVQLIHRQAVRLREASRHDSNAGFFLMPGINELYALVGAAESIKTTPLLRHYSFFTSLFVKVFVFLLPFGFVGALGWSTVPLTVLVGTMFYMLDGVGGLTEDPFENNFNDVPISALCRTVEIDLRTQLGEVDLPPQLEPTDGVLM